MFPSKRYICRGSHVLVLEMRSEVLGVSKNGRVYLMVVLLRSIRVLKHQVGGKPCGRNLRPVYLSSSPGRLVHP